MRTSLNILLLVVVILLNVKIGKTEIAHSRQIEELTSKLKDATSRADQYEHSFKLCVFLLNKE